MNYTTKSNGNIYVEYGIITILVISFFVLSLNLVAGVVKEKFINDFYSGKKIKLTLSGITAEKVGRFGGTKSEPVCYAYENGKKAIDFGYLTIDNLPAPPVFDGMITNQKASGLLRYYAELTNRVSLEIKNNPNYVDQCPYLDQLSDIANGMADMIDRISIYNGRKATSAMPNESFALTAVNIEPFDTDYYVIKDYNIVSEGVLVNLELPVSDYELYNTVGMLYPSVLRYDKNLYKSLWLIKADLNGDKVKESCTISSSSQNYTSLFNVIVLYLDQLRYKQTEEEPVGEEDFRYYNLMKLYDLYSKLYDNLSKDDVTRLWVKLISAEVSNIVWGIKLNIKPGSNNISVKCMPDKKINVNLVDSYVKSVNNMTFKTYKDK